MGDRVSVCLLSSAHGAYDKRVFEKEARALSSAGFAVTHLCPAEAGREAGVEVIDGIRIRRYRRADGITGRIVALPRLFREALRENVNVYHCNEVDSWLVGLVVARLRGAKSVFDVHEHYPSVFASRHLPSMLAPFGGAFIRALFRAFGLLTDGLVFAKATVADDFPRKHSQTALVRNLPPLRLRQSVPAREHRRRLDRVVAVHTGVLRRGRGWPQMLDALAVADDAGLSLHVVGAFTDGSRGAFELRARELGLVNRVRIETWLPFEEAFARLLDADIGLILFQPGTQNHVYASPHKLYDYMLAGLPVIAPAFAVEVAEIVERYDCGLLVDPTDPTEIANAMARLVADPSLRSAMGLRGRDAILNELNWEREAERLLDFYRRLVLGA